MHWSQPNMSSVYYTVNVHTTLTMHKMWIFTILKPFFTVKMWDESRFNLTDRWLWSFVPSCQKWICLSKLPREVISVSKTLSFPQFSMAVACCYNGWNLKTRTWNILWTTVYKNQNRNLESLNSIHLPITVQRRSNLFEVLVLFSRLKLKTVIGHHCLFSQLFYLLLLGNKVQSDPIFSKWRKKLSRSSFHTVLNYNSARNLLLT